MADCQPGVTPPIASATSGEQLDELIEATRLGLDRPDKSNASDGLRLMEPQFPALSRGRLLLPLTRYIPGDGCSGGFVLRKMQ